MTVAYILLYDLQSFLTEKQTDVLSFCLIFEVLHKILFLNVSTFEQDNKLLKICNELLFNPKSY